MISLTSIFTPVYTFTSSRFIDRFSVTKHKVFLMVLLGRLIPVVPLGQGLAIPAAYPEDKIRSNRSIRNCLV